MPADDRPTIPRSAVAPYTDYAVPTTHGIPLSVRLWQVEGGAPSAPAPFVLHTHGGGFLAGHHYLPPWWLHAGFRKRGYHLLAHSYRLGPQVSVADQVADCLEVLAFVRDVLPGLVSIDKDRCVLVGDSAGGTLATLTAARLMHDGVPPRAVVDVYGLTDFRGELELDEKKKEAGYVAPEWKGEFGEEALGRFMMDRDAEKTMTVAMAWNEMEVWNEEELSALWGVEVEFSERIRRHAELNVWAQTRLESIHWMVKGALHPEKFEGRAEEEYKAFVDSVSPLRVLRALRDSGVKGGYPPTAFLHGTEDVSVPVKQSQDLAAVLKEMEVDVVECYEEGVGHVWDRKYTDPSVPGWETYIQPIIDFVDRHVGV